MTIQNEQQIALNTYQQAQEFALLEALKKKEKDEKEKEEKAEERDSLRISFTKPRIQAVKAASGLTEAQMENDAADDIERKIADHKAAVGVHHLDHNRPIKLGNTADNAMVAVGRVVAVNDVFVALAHGRNIEIHRVADLTPNMRYDGQNPWFRAQDILTPGNLIDIKYKGGVAVLANVAEQQRERQQEKEFTKGRGLSR